MSEKEQESVSRCEYASRLLNDKNIEHEIKKKEIGHINLLYNGKPVMSFWARTGKFIFLKIPRGPIITQDDRGIRNCIQAYMQYIELEKKEC